MAEIQKWLQWKNAQEWGIIYCPMLESEVMTYYPIGRPAYDSYTAPFVDDEGDVCYYKFDHDEGAWDDCLFWAGEYEEGMICQLY